MWLGPLAIGVAWLTYVTVFFVSDRSGHTTLSGVAASKSMNRLVFGSGLISSGVLMFLFMSTWFVDVLELPVTFLILVGVSTMFLQPIIAVVPYNGGINSHVHNAAVYMQSSIMPVLAILIARSTQLPSVVAIICWLLFFWMLYMLVEFRRQFLKSKFMLVQASYIGSFHLIILLATFSVWWGSR